MSICGNLSVLNNLTASCGEVGGTQPVGYIFNWNDVNIAIGSNGEVVDITWANACGKGYKFTSRDNANEWKVEGSKTNGAPMFNQTAILRGSVATMEQIAGLQSLAKATRLLVILENNGNAANRFVALGVANGISMTAFSNVSGLANTDLNAFELTLSGVDTDLEKVVTLGATGNANQKTELENLTVLRVPQALLTIETPNNYTILNGDTVLFNGCNLLQCSQLTFGGATIPIPAGVSGSSLNANVVSRTDAQIAIQFTSGGSTYTGSGATQTALFENEGTSAITTPVPVVFNLVD